MLKYWPFKKDYLLVLIIALMVTAGYKLAFKRTMEARSLNKEFKEQLKQQHSVADQPGYTERKDTNLARIIGLYRVDTVTFRNNAINSIALIAEKNNVKFISAPLQEKRYHTEKYMLQKLSFSGDFFSLLKLLNQLQAAKGTGMIRSCSFRVPSGRASPEVAKSVLLDIVFQVVIK
ncbi:hypothetical protein [Mucilaginibacter rubeus]|uniref:Uncharacterized protein n=1 Tax=Mucilaginibacter rubeus TaxID=2027860 RepID=A0A5C1HWF7_9SPHI|nr:hypothetical protein [Mucilaginibacter rubeus]QEM09148.1 hypothetical protein DEO27_003650 [Mucilaginibacter rubeus]